MEEIVLLYTLVNCCFVFWETEIMTFGELCKKENSHEHKDNKPFNICLSKFML